MPTINITVTATVTVPDLKPETVGGVMCDTCAGIMDKTNVQVVTIVDVKTFDK